MARIRLRRLSHARMCGSFAMNPRIFSEPSSGLANIEASTLLLRSANGYVETPPRSSGLIGYCDSATILARTPRGTALGPRVRTTHVRGSDGFLGFSA